MTIFKFYDEGLAQIRVRSYQVNVSSVESDAQVTLARGTKLVADSVIGSASHSDFDVIVCPGGMPGAVRCCCPCEI